MSFPMQVFPAIARTNHAQRFKPPPTEPESFMPSRLPIPNPLRKSSSAEMWSAMQPRSGHMLYGAGDMQGQTFGASHTAGAEGFAGNQGAGSLELSSVARYRTHSSGDVRLKSGGGGAAFYAQDDQYPMTLLVEGLVSPPGFSNVFTPCLSSLRTPLLSRLPITSRIFLPNTGTCFQSARG